MVNRLHNTMALMPTVSRPAAGSFADFSGAAVDAATTAAGTKVHAAYRHETVCTHIPSIVKGSWLTKQNFDTLDHSPWERPI